MMNFRRIKWALRKLFLPIDRSDLVLDVGSGGKPYPRSDVLLDRLTGSEHRCGDSMMIDRLAIFGDAQRMPFKNKAFDFVIASHILEHMADPERFLSELQRVSKAGYIETPNALFERLRPFNIHCLEIELIDETLVIRKKSNATDDQFFAELQYIDSNVKWTEYFHKNPDMFHVRYVWRDTIDYKVYNPETSSAWIETINSESEHGDVKDGYLQAARGWREFGLSVIARFESYRREKRLKDFDLLSILACPECLGSLEERKISLICRNCKVGYRFEKIPDFSSSFTIEC